MLLHHWLNTLTDNWQGDDGWPDCNEIVSGISHVVCPYLAVIPVQTLLLPSIHIMS